MVDPVAQVVEGHGRASLTGWHLVASQPARCGLDSPTASRVRPRARPRRRPRWWRLLAVAAVATRRGGGDSTAPPGTAAAAAAGHHVFIVAALVLTPILAVLGGALFLYAQIYRRRELDPELRPAAADRPHAGRGGGLPCGLALLACWLRTGQKPDPVPAPAKPLRATPGLDTRPRPRLAPAPRAARTPSSSTDWTLAALVWVALLPRRPSLLAVRSRVPARRELDGRACSPDGGRDGANPIWRHCGASATRAAR